MEVIARLAVRKHHIYSGAMLLSICEKTFLEERNLHKFPGRFNSRGVDRFFDGVMPTVTADDVVPKQSFLFVSRESSYQVLNTR